VEGGSGAGRAVKTEKRRYPTGYKEKPPCGGVVGHCASLNLSSIHLGVPPVIGLGDGFMPDSLAFIT